MLDTRAAELQQLDGARAHWLAHTAATRAAAERAKAELSARHVDDTEPERQVTAAEWLAAHRAATAAEDEHREITETDMARAEDNVIDDAPTIDGAERGADGPSAEWDERVMVGPEVNVPDLREIAAVERPPVAEDVLRVPTAEEASAAIARAQRALAEIRAREAADQREAADNRAEELARWHAQDQAAAEQAAEAAVEWDPPMLDRTGAP